MSSVLKVSANSAHSILWWRDREKPQSSEGPLFTLAGPVPRSGRVGGKTWCWPAKGYQTVLSLELSKPPSPPPDPLWKNPVKLPVSAGFEPWLSLVWMTYSGHSMRSCFPRQLNGGSHGTELMWPFGGFDELSDSGVEASGQILAHLVPCQGLLLWKWIWGMPLTKTGTLSLHTRVTIPLNNRKYTTLH